MLARMQASKEIPYVRDLVLLGGGHSHVQVLKSFGMRPEPGVRLTLITPTLETPYSGMLPGCVSGIYSEADIHIELAPLARFAGARLIHAPATGLDLDNQRVEFHGRPPLGFDFLSINIGAVPVPPHAQAVTVKPISLFLPKWRALAATITSGQRLVIIGGGAGGVELALAARATLPAGVHIDLVGQTLMPGHGAAARSQIERVLKERSIGWTAGRVSAESADGIHLDDGRKLEADEVLWVTNVAAPAWLGEAGLAVDASGFVSVDRHLRSVSHPEVFAAGDIAHLQDQERAKSGVYAVRAGPYLAENLRRATRGSPLKTFRAQRQHLALLGTGTGEAIASRGAWAARGRLWWQLKDRIDRRFMEKFNQLPEMDEAAPDVPEHFRDALPESDMRCGGCGAKLAADPLRRVLDRLPAQVDERVRQGIGDDAALIQHGSDAVVLTIDGFRTMVDDPYLFGRIAALHSLNDAFAMAAAPVSALALVTVPLMAEKLMEEDIFQLMRGITDVLAEHGAVLAGGHSAEGADLSVGLAVTAQPGARTLYKGGGQMGDRLILTKPLGTGVVLAAAMRGKAPSQVLAEALTAMDTSNAPAVQILLDHGATAMTDVTGFGVAGHLGEMLRAANLGVELNLPDVPLLRGAADLIGDITSSLQAANELALADFTLKGVRPDDARLRLLADPQTSGGLLAAVPDAEACLADLAAAGYAASDIGAITSPGEWQIRA